MTPADQQAIDAIERDRRKREKELLLLLLLLVDDGRQHAQSAVRLGVDPVQALRNVIVGAPNLNQPGLSGSLADVMYESHVTGFRRVFLMADVSRQLAIAPLEQNERDARQVYTQYAVNATQSLYAQMAGKITQALRDSWNQTVNQQVRILRDALESAGYSGLNPSALETIAEQAVLTGYNDGMFGGYFSPAIAPKLIGFRHNSVLDPATTKICRPRDGLTLRKENVYWLTNWPMLHYRCRSAIVPIFLGQAFEEWESIPTEPPMAGFGAAPSWVRRLVAA